MDTIASTHSSPAILAFAGDDRSKLAVKFPKTGDFGVALSLFKSMVGAGLFALPFAFRLIGIGGGLLSMFAAGVLTYYTNLLIVRTKDVIARDTLRKNLTYVCLVNHTFGKLGGHVVLFLILFTTIGGNSSYLIFCGQVLNSMLPQLPTLAWAGVIAALVLPLCFVASGAFLASISLLGNIGVAVVTIAVLVRGAEVGHIKGIADYPMFESSAFPSSFGIVGFLYACSTTVLTINRAAKNKGRFGVVMAGAMAFTFVACSAFALVNLLYFGMDTCSIIVLNLGGGPLALLSKVAIVIDLVFTYPLSMAGGREVLERTLFDDSTKHLFPKQVAVRTLMVICSFCVCFFPQFSIVVNIVGGWSVSALAFIIPCLMLLKLRHLHLTAYRHQQELVAQRRHSAQGRGSVHEAQLMLRDSMYLPEHVPSPVDGHAAAAALAGKGGKGASPRTGAHGHGDAAAAAHAAGEHETTIGKAAGDSKFAVMLVNFQGGAPGHGNAPQGASAASGASWAPHHAGAADKRSGVVSGDLTIGRPAPSPAAEGSHPHHLHGVHRPAALHLSTSGTDLSSPPPPAASPTAAALSAAISRLPGWFPMFRWSLPKESPAASPNDGLFQAPLATPASAASTASGSGVVGLATATGAAPSPSSASPATDAHTEASHQLVGEGSAHGAHLVDARPLVVPTSAAAPDAAAAASDAVAAAAAAAPSAGHGDAAPAAATAAADAAGHAAAGAHHTLSHGSVGHVKMVVHGHQLHRPRTNTAVDVVAVPQPAAAAAPAAPVQASALSPLVEGSSDSSPASSPVATASAASADSTPAATRVPAAALQGPEAALERFAAVGSASPTAGAHHGAAHPEASHHHHDSGHGAATRRGSLLSKLAHKAGGGKAKRHLEALQLLGVGTPIETVLLVAVILFGIAVLVMTTVQSVKEAIEPPGDVPAICKA